MLNIEPHTGLIGCQCGACSMPLDPRLTMPGDSVDTGFHESDVFEISVDPLAGTVGANGKAIWSPEDIAAHLNRTGANWTGTVDPAPQRGDSDPTTITYSFFANQDELFDNGYVYFIGGGGYGLNEYFNFRAFTDDQKAVARQSMEAWDDLAAVTFVETDVDNADINFGGIQAPQTQAYARLPFGTMSTNEEVNQQVQGIAGDIWVSVNQASNFMLDEGGYGMHTLTHEIGHAIGLSHPGAYNAAPGVSITYGPNAEYYQDTRAYTVMSYFNASSAGARHFDFNISATVYAATPMVHDVAAIQHMYGADMTTRTGHTTYGFNSNAGRDSYDFTLTPAPVMTIWDAGGIDTIDTSGYDTIQFIDLNDGMLSSIGGATINSAPSFEQVNLNRAAAGFAPVALETYEGNMAALAANPVIGRLTDNVGIAYDAIIENAIGGSGADVIIGNEFANVLTGNAGDDALFGNDGDDTLSGGLGTNALTGGAGADLFVIDGAFAGSDRVDDFSADDTLKLANLAGIELVYEQVGEDAIISLGGVAVATIAETGAGSAFSNSTIDGAPARASLVIDGEAVSFIAGAEANDVIQGTNKDDFLFGRGGNDSLQGGNGEDTLYGGKGDDRLSGGNDDDLLVGENGNDWLNGGNGNDVLLGGAGADRLVGENGDDTLIGGEGDDTLTGGRGADTFLFDADGFGGVDTITDFTAGEDSIGFLSEPGLVEFAGGDTGAEMFVDGALTAVFQNVRASDLAGEYLPGTFLPEAALAELSSEHGLLFA